MELQYSELDHHIRSIKLIGRLDILGTGAIETKFGGYCSGDNVRVIVDLSQWIFLPPWAFAC
jgi:anti-anti-sigma regulatory factor